MFCRFCGAPLVAPEQMYCLKCGRQLCEAPKPAKKKSGIGAFFLSLLKGVCYFAVFYGVMSVVQVVYMVALMFFFPNMGMSQSGYMGFSEEYWHVFSKYFCWMSVGTYALIFLVYLVIFACRRKKLWRETDIKCVQFASLPSAFAFGIALQIVTTFVIAFLSALNPAIAENATATDEMYNIMFKDSSVLSQFVMTAVATPIIEELVFRGLIYTRMRKAMPKAAAMILSSLAFGAAHSFGVQLVYAALLGVVLVLLYEKYNSLWVPILLHAGFNATNYLYEFIDMESGLMQLTVFNVALGFALVFVAYFFISKPIYKEDKIDEAV